MYDHVLVPTDGNERMGRVIEQAVSLASLSDARVHALHAVDESAYSVVPSDARERVQSRLVEDGEDATRSVAAAARDAGLSVSTAVWHGPPAHATITYAVENEVDVVVMGTHGRTGYERYLLGSVAERVVRAAPMPVLVVDLDGSTDAETLIDDEQLTDLEVGPIERPPDAVEATSELPDVDDRRIDRS